MVVFSEHLPNQYGVKEYQNKSNTDDEFAYNKNGNYLENRARKLENLKPRTSYDIKILQRLLNNPPNNKMP